MICDRCHQVRLFGYGRIETGKRLILCYDCAKEFDRENGTKK